MISPTSSHKHLRVLASTVLVLVLSLAGVCFAAERAPGLANTDTRVNLDDAPKVLFKNARDGNTWKMVQREVLGNDLSIEMVKGTLQRSYPIQIRAAAGNVAQFKVAGGIAYVPMTFTGVKGYRDPVLEEYVNGSWKRIDQSAYGKDFWQADFYQGSWDITFSANLDSPEDARVTREFRFSIDN